MKEDGRGEGEKNIYVKSDKNDFNNSFVLPHIFVFHKDDVNISC